MIVWSFCRTVLSITGWRFAESLVLMVGLGLTSGASILLLIVLVHASGLEAVQPAREPSALFAAVQAVVGAPSLPVALGAFVLVTALQVIDWEKKPGSAEADALFDTAVVMAAAAIAVQLS